MQDIYAFDIGDFGKFGLLRVIHRVTCLPIGVLWWRTTLGANGHDGKHVEYLDDRRYRQCDSELWESMRAGFRRGPRTIPALHGLLPGSTRFHSEPVPFPGQRERWLRAALHGVQGSEVIFCDPDNGIRLDGDSSPRHVALDEVRTLYGTGASLVLYHTPGRSGSHPQQIRTALARFDDEIPRIGALWAAHLRRGSSRAFLVLVQPRHVDAFERAFETLRHSAWVTHAHFDIIRQELTSARPKLSETPLPVPTPGGTIRLPEPVGNNGSKGPPAAAAPGVAKWVRVVLNDNGGLNTAANPWLSHVEPPCRVLDTAERFSFVVEATFRGRTDMFRVRPSTLTVARQRGFTGEHLSGADRVEFEAVIRGTRSA